MSDLQTATDIVALVFMGLVLLIIVILLFVALSMKRKVTRFKRDLRNKTEAFRFAMYLSKHLFKNVKKR